MRYLIVVIALTLTGCGPAFWLRERFECGLKCPKNSSCKPVTSGVFMSTNGCVCDYGLTPGGFSRPSRGEACPAPKPSATPTPSCPEGSVWHPHCGPHQTPGCVPAHSHLMTSTEKHLLSADSYAWVCDDWRAGYAYPTPERPCR